MERKKPEKILGNTWFQYSKRESQKTPKGERKSEITLNIKVTVILTLSVITLLISLLENC